jgi:predicted MPP superfamily phosphohydrolase
MNRSLRFRTDGSITIVQFTDTHLCNGEKEDVRTAALMSQVLDEEQPDLVIFTGNVIGGHSAKSSEATWCMAAAPLIARGLPWCAGFGNHDDECGVSRRQLLAIQRKISGCPSQF